MITKLKFSHWIGACALLILLATACTPQTPAPTEPPVFPSPTVDVVSVTQTFEAIVTAAQQTVVAELTAQAPPTQTSAPTTTPIVITATIQGPGATPTASGAQPTATQAPGQQVTSTTAPLVTSTPALTTCQIVSQSPAFGSDFSPREDLDLRWVVRNTSGQQWNQGETDYVFVSGADFHKQAAYDLNQNVPVNEEVEIVVDVIAPAAPGRYSATWAIETGSRRVCIMSATIDVVE